MPQEPTEPNGREWAARWSRDIGELIAFHRKTAGLTAAKLAEQCASLGYPITRSQIAGIESGRKAAITVAEIQVFAHAIGVSPLLLLFPVGLAEEIEPLPGHWSSPWEEVLWWIGKGMAIGQDNVESGFARSDSKKSPQNIPLHLFEAHDKAIHNLQRVRMLAVDPKSRDALDEVSPDAEDLALDYLRSLRELMREKGLRPPDLPRGLLPNEPQYGEPRLYDTLHDVAALRVSSPDA